MNLWKSSLSEDMIVDQKSVNLVNQIDWKDAENPIKLIISS